MQIKRSTAWNRAFEELKHHQNLLGKLGKSQSVTHNNNTSNNAVADDIEGPKPSKMRRNQESSESSQGSQVAPPNGASPVKLIKDLRVRVERLMSDGNSEIQLNQEKSESANGEGDGGPEEKPDVNDGSRSISEERQVPFLPVATDDEPPLRITSSTCPQGLKKEGSQEDMVTSSSQEPRSKCVLVQTEEVQPETAPAKVTSLQSSLLNLYIKKKLLSVMILIGLINCYKSTRVVCHMLPDEKRAQDIRTAYDSSSSRKIAPGIRAG